MSGIRGIRGIHGGDIYRNNISLDFSVNMNPLGIPDAVKEALKQAVERSDVYPDIETLALKEAVSRLHRIPKENLVFGNGASELFLAIVHALKPKHIVIPTPSFYGYEHAAKAAGAAVRYISLDEKDDFLPGENLLDALDSETDLLFLANPNNPTGKLMDTAYLKKLLKLCDEKRIVVVLDECFLDFCRNGCSMIPALSEYENLIIVRAFTKIFSIPGVRLGYIISHNPAMIKKLREHLPEWNVSVFAQEAGVACAAQTEYVRETMAFVEKERIFLQDGLEQIGLHVVDSRANFMLIQSRISLYEALLNKGILIRDCSNFRGLSQGYYRIAVRQRDDNERLLKAIGECIERD